LVKNHQGYDIIVLMMGTEMVPEKSVTFNQLTRLIVREDFIKVESGGTRKATCGTGCCMILRRRRTLLLENIVERLLCKKG
jgi:hypothetical protein